jgi:hypothetical protein
MDADGKDRPEDVPRLIQKFRQVGERKVIFAERIRDLTPRSGTIVVTQN